MRTLIPFFLVLASTVTVFGQDPARKSVVVGTLISRPSAILVLNPPGADQGFLLPQLTTAQRLTIVPSSPQDDGLMVFDTDEKSFYHWKSNGWIKGLGDEATDQLLSYDATTHQLSLSSNGGTVDLSALKEVPAVTGQSGKYLTTDGVTLSWATISSIGDITGIIAGQGLSGGATTGDASLSVNTDGTTIGINGSNQLQVLDGAVTTQKLAVGAVGPANISSGGNDKVLTTTPTGTVTWADRSAFTDAQNLSLSGNQLNIDNGVGVDLNALTIGGAIAGPLTNMTIADGAITTPKIAPNAVNTTHIADGAVSSTDITDNTILAADLANGAVTPTKIQPGANNQILVTDGTGNTAWVNQSILPANIVVDGTTITGNGTSGSPLSVGVNSIEAIHIVAKTIGTSELANDAVTEAALADDAVDGAAIQDNAITTTKLADDAVTTPDILNSAVTPAKIQPGTNNQVLVTNGAGTTAWIDQTLLPSNVVADGTFITGAGTSGNPLTIGDNSLTENKIAPDAITASELANGSVDANAIQGSAVNSAHILDGTVATTDLLDNAITTTKLAADAVTTTDILNSAVTPAKIQPGANNQVLVTDGAGITAWIDQTLLPPNVVVDGTTITGNATSGNPLTVGTNSITATHIAADAVSNSELADNAVDGAAVQDNAITTTKLAADAVTTPDIQNSAVTPLKIQPGTNNQVLVTDGAGVTAWINQTLLPPNVVVDGTTITGNATSGNPLTVGTNSITATHIAADAVSTSELANNAVEAGELADNAVDGAAIQADAITTTKLAADAVTTTDILNSAVTPAKIQPGANNQVLVTDGTGTTTWINQTLLPPNVVADGTFITGTGTSGNPLTIGANSLTDNQLAPNAVTASELADGSVDANAIQAGVVNSTHILDATVANADIQDNAINTAKLAVDAVTTPDIQNSAVTPLKIQPGANNQVLVTDGTGTTTWINQTLLPPNVAVDGTTITGNATSGNPLAVGANSITDAHITANAVGNSELADDAVGSGELADNAVDGPAIQSDAITTAKIAADAVTPAKIQPGANNQVLVTDGVGTTAWINQTLLPPNVVADGTFVTGTGTSGNPLTIGANSLTDSQLAPNAVTASELADGSVDANAIQSSAVTPAKIQPGANNQVLVTDGTGTTTWINQTLLPPNVVADGTFITGTGTSGTPLTIGANSLTENQLATDAVTAVELANGAVDVNAIQSSAVTPIKIQPGTNNQVLVTDGTGTTTWINQTLLPPNVVADGTFITGTGTSGTPLTIGANSLTENQLATDAVTAVELANGAVDANAIQSSAVTPIKIQPGANNQVMVTDGTGATAWLNRTDLPAAGDVTGTLGATTVARIQGRSVTTAVPNTGEALIWNGTAWAPAVVTVSPTVQYYAVDPASFQGLQPNGNTQAVSGIYEDEDGIFVTAHGNAREIVAPVNLPHGATIQAITLYYEYTSILGLLAMTVKVYRKPLAGGANQQLATVSPLLSLGVSSSPVNITAAAASLVIDNSTYSYRVHATISGLSDVTSDDGAAQRVYGLRIQYLK